MTKLDTVMSFHHLVQLKQIVLQKTDSQAKMKKIISRQWIAYEVTKGNF